MFRKTSLVAAIVSVVALTVAFPASANSITETGVRISLFTPPATFPANTPFHIEHGFIGCQPIGDCANANNHFDLYLDGVLQPSRVDIEVTPDGADPIEGVIPDVVFSQKNLTNYPSGLPAGSHEFVGLLYFDGVLVGTLDVTIVFT